MARWPTPERERAMGWEALGLAGTDPCRVITCSRSPPAGVAAAIDGLLRQLLDGRRPAVPGPLR